MEENQLKNEMQDAKDQNELLEFRVLELEVRDSICCKLSNGADILFEPRCFSSMCKGMCDTCFLFFLSFSFSFFF